MIRAPERCWLDPRIVYFEFLGQILADNHRLGLGQSKVLLLVSLRAGVADDSGQTERILFEETSHLIE